MLVKLERCY